MLHRLEISNIYLSWEKGFINYAPLTRIIFVCGPVKLLSKNYIDRRYGIILIIRVLEFQTILREKKGFTNYIDANDFREPIELLSKIYTDRRYVTILIIHPFCVILEFQTYALEKKRIC